jgi:hypothetical protein
MRYISPESLVFWFIFFWIALGYKCNSETDPENSYETNSVLMENLILKFFMSSLIILMIGLVQWILHLFNNWINGNALNQFKDLCTFANISLIMLDEPIHGYYLNAKAPWGSSDIPLDWLQQEL